MGLFQDPNKLSTLLVMLNIKNLETLKQISDQEFQMALRRSKERLDAAYENGQYTQDQQQAGMMLIEEAQRHLARQAQRQQAASYLQAKDAELMAAGTQQAAGTTLLQQDGGTVEVKPGHEKELMEEYYKFMGKNIIERFIDKIMGKPQPTVQEFKSFEEFKQSDFYQNKVSTEEKIWGRYNENNYPHKIITLPFKNPDDGKKFLASMAEKGHLNIPGPDQAQWFNNTSAPETTPRAGLT